MTFFQYIVRGLIFFALVDPVLALAGSAAKPASASYKGTLYSISGIFGEVSGKTVTISQPWATNNSFFIVKNSYYFRSDGFIDSEFDLNVPWRVDNNGRLCIFWKKGPVNCYKPFLDGEDQAFLLSVDSGFLFKVEEIVDGDSAGMKQLYAARKKAEQDSKDRAERAMYALFGLFGAISGGGFGGGGGGQTKGCIEDPSGPGCRPTEINSSTGGGSTGAPPIAPLYGTCHNPMGC